jgi:hypothetical protein
MTTPPLVLAWNQLPNETDKTNFVIFLQPLTFAELSTEQQTYALYIVTQAAATRERFTRDWHERLEAAEAECVAKGPSTLWREKAHQGLNAALWAQQRNYTNVMKQWVTSLKQNRGMLPCPF